ncbi:UBP-type zinc finger domain-containing protein [Steroidobacter sp.]|uniref:UBP-type zinc finger domain-containing protein n=1 Tax=Steroidobacter sp. TaxID=1978227 RepID=UPI0032C22D6C
MSTLCTHLDFVQTNAPTSRVCEECLRLGNTWIHLRVCRTCGHVGCCDDSKNRHARKHFDAMSHPIITSMEPGETWSWCFLDRTLVKGLTRLAPFK